MEDNKQKNKQEDSGLASRTEKYKDVYRKTRDHRATVRAYCSGNKWLTENAKATGNW